MLRSIIFVFVLLFSNLSWAAAYTSTGSGKWSNAATWGGGGVPGIGDTATIDVGDIVTIDGNITVGTSPAAITTYDLDINGILRWPASPGASWTFQTNTSTRVGATGAIVIGDPASGFDCDYTAKWVFGNNAAAKKYHIYLNGGLLYAYGCEDFDTSSGSVHRARIASCAPNCNAGAGRTIKLDRDVNWTASGSFPGAPWDGARILIGVGGNETSFQAAGDDPEEITTWTSPSASEIGGVTLVENHKVGDMVVNASRNVVFQSDSATNHGYIYTAANDDPYDLQWIMLDEMGDNTTAASALTFNNNNNTFGTAYHVAALNCEDGGSTTCFYVYSDGWTQFEGNIAFDVRGGNGFYFNNTNQTIANWDIDDCTAIEGRSGFNGYGVQIYLRNKNTIDGLWCSHMRDCAYANATQSNVLNSVLHGNTAYGISTADTILYIRNQYILIEDNEVRNSTTSCIELQANNYIFQNNDIDGCGDNCVYSRGYDGLQNVIAKGNSYDRCNTDNSTLQGGILFETGIEVIWYAMNESFGQTTQNNKANVMAEVATNNTARQYNIDYRCMDCTMADAAAVNSCVSLPDDVAFPTNCHISDLYTAYIPDGTFLMFQNKDGVEYSNVGMGPGGMVIKRTTAVNYTTSNIKVHVVPSRCNDYAYMPVGSFYVADNTAVTVDLYLRKDEAQATTGYRPRLALKGLGFVPTDHYDEMSDVTNTWEKVTVSGTSDGRGVIHILVGVRNNLSGVDGYTCVHPPTLDVYADGLNVTK